MPPPDAFFYPFHLCHPRTLEQLLERFTCVHFRDYMALRLSPFVGTTAYPDRMGDFFPDLIAAGRLKQGYCVSGPLSRKTSAAIDRDLSDAVWRARFHEALRTDRRMQRGLFGESFLTEADPTRTDRSSRMTRLSAPWLQTAHFSSDGIAQLSQQRLSDAETDRAEYGLAMLKTSASLVYTVQIATAEQLAVATDSQAHFMLLAVMSARDGITVSNHWIDRRGY
jgi:hypothetical protein